LLDDSGRMPDRRQDHHLQVRKALQAKLLPDGTTVGFSISETREGEDQPRSVSVELTPAEFTVVTELAKFLIPLRLGFHKKASQPRKASDTARRPQTQHGDRKASDIARRPRTQHGDRKASDIARRPRTQHGDRKASDIAQ
jgi:hypothetical protein